MAMLPTVYLNGEYLDRQHAALNLSDLALLRGYGVFDYFRYADGRPRFIDDHLDRFARSAELLHLKVPVDKAGLNTAVHELIDRNGGSDGGIRFLLTGGYADDGYTPSEPNLAAMAYSFTPPPTALYERGCRVVLHEYERQLPRAKSIDYIEGIRIQPMLRQRGADYALYVDRDGYVRESDRSNFMIVRDGVLITPADNVLLGVTRKHIFKLASAIGIPTEERAVNVEEVMQAREALICSSVKGVMPITEINDQAVSDGKPGPITRRLLTEWQAYVNHGAAGAGASPNL